MPDIRELEAKLSQAQQEFEEASVNALSAARRVDRLVIQLTAAYRRELKLAKKRSQQCQS